MVYIINLKFKNNMTSPDRYLFSYLFSHFFGLAPLLCQTDKYGRQHGVNISLYECHQQLKCIHKDIEQILMQNEYTNDDMRRIIEKIVVYPDKSVEIFMK